MDCMIVGFIANISPVFNYKLRLISTKTVDVLYINKKDNEVSKG